MAAIYAAKGRPAFNPLIAHVADLAAAERIARFDAPRPRDGGALLAGPPHPGAAVHGRRAASAISPARGWTPWPCARPPIRSPRRCCGRSKARSPRPRPTAPAAPAPPPAPTPWPRPARAPPWRWTAAPARWASSPRCSPCCPASPPAFCVPAASPARRWRRRWAPPLAPAEAAGADARRSPGRLALHYAPDAPVRLDATHPPRGRGLPQPSGRPLRAPTRALSLSATADPAEAAAALFTRLRQADARRPAAIAVARSPRTAWARRSTTDCVGRRGTSDSAKTRQARPAASATSARSSASPPPVAEEVAATRGNAAGRLAIALAVAAMTRSRSEAGRSLSALVSTIW